MSRGILELVGWMTAVLVVVPPAFAGVGLLFRGNLAIGVVLLCVAVGMAVADQYITTPGDVPLMIASKLVGVVAREPDEDEE